MPRATLSTEPQLIELRSCPEGFVKLRRMSYGELMKSEDMAYQVSMKNLQADNPEMGLDVSRAAVTEFQFKTCIVDHNLEDDNGRKLNFANAQDLHLLDSNIGQEIQTKIDDLHNWNKQFPNSSGSSSSESSVVPGSTVNSSQQTSGTSEQLQDASA